MTKLADSDPALPMTDARRRRRRRRRGASTLGFWLVADALLLVAAGIVLWFALPLMQEPQSQVAGAVLPAVSPQSALATAEPLSDPGAILPTPPPASTVLLVATPAVNRGISEPALKATATLGVTATTVVPTVSRVSTLTLKDIFLPRDLGPLKLEPGRLRTIIATGDVVPARSTDAMIRRHDDDFLYPVSATKDILAAGDLTVVNLEAPLITKCPAADLGFTLCGRPGFAAALSAAGVDVVTLENNHIGNYGYAGVLETIKYLGARAIAYADRVTPAVQDVRGIKFGFLAFDGVGVQFDRKAIADQIKALRPKVDVLVVAMHWGKEYVDVPEIEPGIAPDDPREMAHLVIDAGADLIIGNHPHWVQGVELYKGKYIAYAHGNFIFDQMWSDETRIGVIGRYTFYDRELVKVDYIPILIEDYGKPVPMQGKDAQAVLDKMKEASQKLVK